MFIEETASCVHSTDERRNAGPGPGPGPPIGNILFLLLIEVILCTRKLAKSSHEIGFVDVFFPLSNMINLFPF